MFPLISHLALKRKKERKKTQNPNVAFSSKIPLNDAPGTAPQRSLRLPKSHGAAAPRVLRFAHLSRQAPGARAGAVAAGLLPYTIRGHGHGLPKGPAGGACALAAWPSPCASSRRIWLQKSQVLGPPSFPSEDSLVQPRGLLCSTPGSSLGPPAARASFLGLHGAPRSPRTLVPTQRPRLPGLRVCSAWVRAPAAGPAPLPTRSRPASDAPGLSAGPPSVFLLPQPHLLPKSCYF